MATKNSSITNTRVYSDAINTIRTDVEAWFKNSAHKTSVRLPASLVSVIRRRKDSEVALDDVKKGVATALSDYCFVDRWVSGKDEDGEFVQFRISPERIFDEV
jgi:hypothetical protein